MIFTTTEISSSLREEKCAMCIILSPKYFHFRRFFDVNLRVFFIIMFF